jgi:hypothetical protein
MSGRQWNIAMYQGKKECESLTKKRTHPQKSISYVPEKRFAKMERHPKLWKEMDCRNGFLIYKANVW